MPDPTSTPSGWFPDPLERYDHRYFNGITWTSDVSTGGQRYVDPLGTGPGRPTGAGRPTNGAATAAVVMGSIGVAIAWIPFIVLFGAILAVLALVFGIIGVKRSRVAGVGRGASIAGIVMGSIGVAASVVGVILSIVVLREVIRFVEPGETTTQLTACSVEGRRADVRGTITNLDDEAREYTLFVEVGRRTEAVVVDELQPGDTAEWSTIVTMRSADAECDPDITVQGPYPYGIEVDPVE